MEDKATKAAVFELLRVVEAIGERKEGVEIAKRIIAEELHKFRLEVLDEAIDALKRERRRQKEIFYGS